MEPLFVEQDDIFEACRVGALAKVKMFVEVKNTGLNGKDADKRSPLHWAAASGHGAIVEYLLEKGAHGDTVDDDGWSPLLSSSSRGSLEIVAMLLAHGASVERHTESSKGTALHYAVGKGHLEVARALLDASAPTEARNSVGETPMHRCCTARAHAAELVQLLVAHKANVNARNKDGDGPLHLAAADGNVGLASALLAAGAEQELLNNAKKTPRDLAPEHMHEALRRRSD